MYLDDKCLFSFKPPGSIASKRGTWCWPLNTRISILYWRLQDISWGIYKVCMEVRQTWVELQVQKCESALQIQLEWVYVSWQSTLLWCQMYGLDSKTIRILIMLFYQKENCLAKNNCKFEFNPVNFRTYMQFLVKISNINFPEI